MALFTVNEVEKLLGIIDRNSAILVAKIIGKESLSPLDELLLKKSGLNINKISSKFPPYWQSYMFGRLVGQLSPDQAKLINYNDYTKYLKLDQFAEPTKREIESYKIASKRTYAYIKGMGQRQREMLSDAINDAELEFLNKQEQDVIKEKISDGVLRREGVKKIVSKLGSQLDTWSKDWDRIVETEMQSIYNMGISQTITDDHGADSTVYYDVFAGACKHCIRLYTTSGIGSEPKKFKLPDLIANGTNIGRKAKDWLPTLGALHPFCRCQLRYLPKGYKWDKDKKAFTPDKDFKRKVERKSKAIIKVGDKKFEV